MSGTLVAAVLALALFGVSNLASYKAGVTAERSGWRAQQAAEVLLAQSQYEDTLRQANRAAAAAQADARQAQAFSTALQQEISHVRVPLVVPSARVVVKSADACAFGPRVFPAAADQPPPGLDARGATGLTLSAVRLWNSALAGAELPAGACRADEPESAACAAASGASLEDAFGNHAENAARCRQDRARLDRLSAYLQSQQSNHNPAASPPTPQPAPTTATQP